jgi:hypothetical protein
MQAINVIPGIPRTALNSIAGFAEQDPAIAQRFYLIAGTTTDQVGSALGNCIVYLYRTSDDLYIAQTVSNATGQFVHYALGGVQYYLVAYKPGSPDVVGTTLNTLTGTPADTIAPTDVTDSLLGWWKFDEGTGTNAADSSGNGYAATLSAGAAWLAPGKFGPYALNCGSAAGYASVSGQSLTGVGDISVTFRIQLTVTASKTFISNNKFVIFNYGPGHGPPNSFGVTSDGSVTSANSSQAITADSLWHDLAVTRTSTGSTHIYFDGVDPDGALSSGTPAAPSTDLKIGADNALSPMNGYLDDVRVYNRILTAAEVLIIHNRVS